MKLKSYNAIKLCLHIVFRCVSHFPCAIPIDALFVQLRQQSNSRNFFLIVMLKVQFTVHMDDLVIPSWHMLMMLCFGWIPIGRNIGVFCLKDKHRLAAILQGFMHPVCECNMPNQLIATSNHWEMIDFKIITDA